MPATYVQRGLRVVSWEVQAAASLDFCDRLKCRSGHQNVQSLYAVRVRKRDEIMNAPFKQNHFEIIHRTAGDQAAPSLDDWQQERGEELTLQ